MIISKSDIKFIRSLGQKKVRDELGLFVVEGEKMVSEGLNSGLEVVYHLEIDDIGEETMSRITLLSSPSPALAVLKKPSPERINLPYQGLSIALDGIHDPGNMGTILRIADWFGIEKIFASKDSVEQYNPKTIQASMGAIFRKQVIYIDLATVISAYSDSGIKVYGTFLDGNNLYKENLTKENALIVFGSENNGISPTIASQIHHRLFIPPFPPTSITTTGVNNSTALSPSTTSESLNVAIATAIICAEFRR